MVKKFAVGLLTAAVVGLASMPAQAAPGEAGTMIYRGVARVVGLCYPGLALANHSGAAGCANGVTVNSVNAWSLDTGTDPLDFCIGVNHKGEVGVATGDAVGKAGSQGKCDLTGSGTIVKGPASEGLNQTPPVGVGPYCGAAHGVGSTKSYVGTTTTFEQIEYIQSAATVLPITDADPNNSRPDRDSNGDGIPDGTPDKVLIAGVTDAVGSLSGGDCGAKAASVGFNVVGVSIAIGQ